MKLPLFWFAYLIGFAASGQNLTLREVCSLPASLSETSGLESTGPNQFWTHNDSGGQAALYGLDTLGNITRTITLSNATNVDWEDISRDSNGNLYLGDFGNNNNDRKNLRIYKIPSPAGITGNTVSAGIIQFSYPDQKAYPPADNQKNFDMEAMLFFKDSLYLFSKNKTLPFNGYTKLYRLPTQPGMYTAVLVDSLYTGTDAIAGQITAAAVSPDGKRVALLSYTKLYVFGGFTGSAFFKGQLTQLDIGSLTQKEGICFADNCTIYITDEEFFSTGRRLYKANICPLTTGLNGLLPDPAMSIEALYPNPAILQVSIRYRLPPLMQEAELFVYNLYGQKISRSPLSPLSETIVLPVSGWTGGIYYCRIETLTSAGYSRKLAIVK
jgi:hypothetical protein